VVKNIASAAKKITKAVMSWEGISSRPHRFGGTEFRLGKRALGHLHGNYLLDIPSPMKLRNELAESHCAEPHHIHPERELMAIALRASTICIDTSQAI
jgi:hypothetical protein